MKLLTKSDITKAKVNDRQLEMNEGMKLAKRVDSLRETVLEEEASLQKFREKAVTEIVREIKEVSVLRDVLKTEVEELERRKILAQIPLDEEWKLIQKREQHLDEAGLFMVQMELSIGSKEAQLLENLQQLKLKEKETEDMHIEAKTLLSKADIIKSESEEKLLTVEKTVEKLDKDRNELQVKIMGKELEFEEKDKALKERELQLVKDKKELGVRERQLRDREATLARNIQRYGPSITRPK